MHSVHKKHTSETRDENTREPKADEPIEKDAARERDQASPNKHVNFLMLLSSYYLIYYYII